MGLDPLLMLHGECAAVHLVLQCTRLALIVCVSLVCVCVCVCVAACIRLDGTNALLGVRCALPGTCAPVCTCCSLSDVQQSAGVVITHRRRTH
jgi:hypothetical protein